MNTFNLIATAASGVEALVGKELRDLGFETQVENGRVRFQGTQKDILKANVWLRTADRVKIIVGEFDAYTFDELFEKVKALPWSSYLAEDSEFPVTGRSHESKLFSVSDIQSITKKAIVNHLQAAYHTHEFLPETGVKHAIDVQFIKDHVLITMDTSGEGLFKRGYRVNKGPAPLKENFAAALVMLTNWFPDNPLVDPTTGSGTIPIEAALIGRNIAPGLNRDFQIEQWPWFDPKISEEVRDEAEAQADYDSPLNIRGYDIDPQMIKIAKENARHAGLSQDITFETLPAVEWRTDEINGIIIANPPYGERLDDLETVRFLYQEMGEYYRTLTTWSKYILTSDESFEKYFGAKATKKRKLYNGAIKGDFYQYWGKKIR